MEVIDSINENHCNTGNAAREDSPVENTGEFAFDLLIQKNHCVYKCVIYYI